ncbi:MAG: DUF4111 domain-containing protein [Candidatus Bipolaricaulis sp.]|nr:DUF4111 domain-containing protein [Candidatus Bipolaricaulis sp.]
MRSILIEHARRYPRWQLADLYKLVHQSAMGSEHAVADEAHARARLTREMAEMGPGPSEPLIDPISPNAEVVRVHLRPYRREGFDPDLLLNAFVQTARQLRGSPERIEAGLAEAVQLARDGSIAFAEVDIAAVSARMRESGFPAVHHSDIYVVEYRPAYRVVSRATMDRGLRALCGEGEGAMGVLPEYRGLCAEFAAGVRRTLGEKLYAVYICGAVTFPETEHTGDVDFHAILVARPTDEERAGLLQLHERLEREASPVGTDLDGYYVLLEDARRAMRPRHLLFPEIADESWALHRAHMLAGRVAVLYGPNPSTIFAPPTREELGGALDGELDYVARHLTDYPGYCVLNLCRLLYSWETGDVVTSKAAAAAWASERFPTYRALIALGSSAYAGRATAGDLESLANGLPAFYSFAQREIESLRSRRAS